MTEYHYLQGSEEVSKAGHNMVSASETFRQSTNWLIEEMVRTRQVFEELVERLEALKGEEK